jgi:ATP-binding cassette subfamily C (CFTR/MRP) protein 4
LYQEAEIVLFDDTLSAVDGTVAKNIIKNCINGYLKNKTRVLITHQIHHLETADKIVVLKNGRIEAQGTYRELYDSHLVALSSMNADESQQIEEIATADENIADENIEKEAKAISDEFKAKELVSLSLHLIFYF